MAYEGAIGIDLGTTYSCVGVWQNERVEIIANDQGNRTTPSYVAFTDTERLIGDAAKNQVTMNPTNTVFGAKRLIGRKFSDPVVQSDTKHCPFKVISDANDNPLVLVHYHGETKTFRPEEITAMVLVNMKQVAESYLHMEVKKAVISVPQHFTQRQRQATMDAGTIAGLDVQQIINEPTAAAIAYRLNNKEYIRKYMDSNYVLIFDLGGGRFDVTLLYICSGNFFDVQATHGDPHLGGEDFDSRLVAHCIDEFKRKNNGKDPSNNQRALRRLRTACERAKHTLSSAEEATIEIDALFDNIDFRATITRARFEELCDDLFRRLMQSVEQVMQDVQNCGIRKYMVHDVVLVGGSTRIPKVQQMVSGFFRGKALINSINPDEAVAYGAAVLGFILTGGKSKQTKGFGKRHSVTPHTIGIETDGGVMKPIIERNNSYPRTDRHFVSTTLDNQTAIPIRVFEGESDMTKDCHFIGEVKVSSIPHAPRGKTKIEVIFKIDQNGILNVTAKDEGTSNYYLIDITYDKSRFSKADLERMVSDASKYEEQDKQQLERLKVEAIKQLENTISALKNNMDDPNFLAKLDAESTRIMNKSIIENLEWLYKNPMTSKDEYELRNKKLKEALSA